MTYLDPYQRAVTKHGPTFKSLLWNSPATQETRFHALVTAAAAAGHPPKGRTVLDVGCGRADLLTYLQSINQHPSEYIGIEAIPDLASAARQRIGPTGTIKSADFVTTPLSLFTGSQIVVCCGSLNTFPPSTFQAALRRLYDACAEILVFNFLSSPDLAHAEYLYWHPIHQVEDLCRSFSPYVTTHNHYLPGDTTIAIQKYDPPL